MDAILIKNMARKDFNNAVALMSIIPVLGFVYLIVGRISSLSVLEGEVGYIILALLVLILLGIITGRRLMWYMITKIIDMQNELVEKGRLAAISETVISLAHEIKNPLAIILGNVDLMMGQSAEAKTLSIPRDRAQVIQTNCDRISVVIDKMGRISKPSFTTVIGDVKMLDLPACELKPEPKK